MKIQSWGRISAPEHQALTLNNRTQVSQKIAQTTIKEKGLAFGMGRSYGDSCLNPDGQLWQTRGLDLFIDFDETNGVLTCESGVLLRDIHALTIACGWMLPATPGTQLITVGGAIANDIHGKNHHQFGSFGHHVLGFELARTTGEVLSCSPTHNSDWFCATMGGLGLTGIITQARLQLRRVNSPWLHTKTQSFQTLDEFFTRTHQAIPNWEHTVAWIDCLSKHTRGILMCANPVSFPNALAAQAPNYQPKSARTFPITPPFSLVNRYSLRPFNSAYFHLHQFKTGESLTHYEPFFYPLDSIAHWNRMYGKRGFYQYQCVIPKHNQQDAVAELLNTIRNSGEGSFLAVLKTFGARESLGMLSFPCEGATLALDFANKGTQTSSLFASLDTIVAEAGGRIYPAKDARMPRWLFEKSYPNLPDFLKFRDPGIASGLSKRLID
jgi:FAD/FMN-containing dehydrogenase